VSFLCLELSRELAALGRLDRVEGLCTALERGLARFGQLYQARAEEALLCPAR
jgi:hypothetical protein